MNRVSNRTDATRDGQAIDRVLIGLRDAEAPAGMEDRVLRNLEAHREAYRRRRGSAFGLSLLKGIRVPGPSRPRWAFASPYIAVGTALAAGAALAALMAAVSFVHSTGRGAAPISAQSAANPTASRLPDAPGEPHRPSPNLPSRPVRGAKDASASPSAPLSDEDALALAEMLAPSKPAPPLPLTPQEKMLAEVVHRGEPEELANLSPEFRAKEMELSRAEFRDFFEPSPAKDNE